MYYEKKAKRKVTQRAAEAANEWDDENYDYVLSMEDTFGEHYIIKERIGKARLPARSRRRAMAW